MFKRWLSGFLVIQHIYVYTLSAFGPEGDPEYRDKNSQQLITIKRTSSDLAEGRLIVPSKFQDIEALVVDPQEKTFSLLRQDQDPIQLENAFQPIFPWHLSSDVLLKVVQAHTFFLKQFEDGTFKFEMRVPVLGGIGGWDGTSSHSDTGGWGGGSGGGGWGRDSFYSGGGTSYWREGPDSHYESHRDGWNCDSRGQNCSLVINVGSSSERYGCFGEGRYFSGSVKINYGYTSDTVGKDRDSSFGSVSTNQGGSKAYVGSTGLVYPVRSSDTLKGDAFLPKNYVADTLVDQPLWKEVHHYIKSFSVHSKYSTTYKEYVAYLEPLFYIVRSEIRGLLATLEKSNDYTLPLSKNQVETHLKRLSDIHLASTPLRRENKKGEITRILVPKLFEKGLTLLKTSQQSCYKKSPYKLTQNVKGDLSVSCPYNGLSYPVFAEDRPLGDSYLPQDYIFDGVLDKPLWDAVHQFVKGTLAKSKYSTTYEDYIHHTEPAFYLARSALRDAFLQVTNSNKAISIDRTSSTFKKFQEALEVHLLLTPLHDQDKPLQITETLSALLWERGHKVLIATQPRPQDSALTLQAQSQGHQMSQDYEELFELAESFFAEYSKPQLWDSLKPQEYLGEMEAKHMPVSEMFPLLSGLNDLCQERKGLKPDEDKSFAHYLGGCFLNGFCAANTWALEKLEQSPQDAVMIASGLEAFAMLPVVMMGTAESLLRGTNEAPLTQSVLRDLGQITSDSRVALSAAIAQLDLTAEEKVAYGTLTAAAAKSFLKLKTNTPLSVAEKTQLREALIGIGAKTSELREFTLLKANNLTTRSQFWTKSETFTYKNQTNKVYQRNDLIDLNRRGTDGRTNLQRMRDGDAPIGPDGESINLHHMLQTMNSPIAEVTETFHQQYTKIIHINPKTIPSGIDRGAFKQWKRQYWKNRAKELGGNN